MNTLLFISDIHLKNNQHTHNQWDWIKKTLINFSHCHTYFLGDIFDFLIGYQMNYFENHHHFFDIFKSLNQNQKLYYFEGNHDFHLSKMFQHLNTPNVHLMKKQLSCNIDNKKFYISHGDELEVDNLAYQRYKTIIRSPFCEMLAEELISYEVLVAIKEWLAKKSKDAQKNFNRERRRDLYRGYARQLWDKGYQHVIVGHNHVLDELYEKIDGVWHSYHNLGYFPEDRKVLEYCHGEFQWIVI